MRRTPKKLKSDAIADAICEIRFDCTENREAPEIVVGMLAGHPDWKQFRKRRLPEADIPDQVRRSDPNLIVRPLLELTSDTNSRKLLVGTHSISTIRSRPYPGWASVRSDIVEITDRVFSTLDEVSVFRVGLRYINVLESKTHGINSMHDLRFKVEISNKPLRNEVNLNYIVTDGEFRSTVRVATPEFVNNLSPANGIGVVDIDTESTSTDSFTNPTRLQEWFASAHEFEKDIFFGLFDNDVLKEIVSEWE